MQRFLPLAFAPAPLPVVMKVRHQRRGADRPSSYDFEKSPTSVGLRNSKGQAGLHRFAAPVALISRTSNVRVGGVTSRSTSGTVPSS